MRETVEQELEIADSIRNGMYTSPDGRWLFGWDEEANGICAWPRNAAEDTPATRTFGDDEADAAPQIVAWLASLPVEGERDA